MRRSAALLLVVHTKALVRRAGIQAQYKLDNGHFPAPVSYIYIYIYKLCIKLILDINMQKRPPTLA